MLMRWQKLWEWRDECDGFVEVSQHFPPHPLTPSPTVGRRGIGCSCSPLPGVGEGLGERG